MQKYSDVVQDRQGNAIASCIVTVTDYPSGTTSTTYAADAIGTTTNPITADSNGGFSFYAKDGSYTLTITKSGITTATKVITLRDNDDVVSVKGYGAVGDGTTDDTAAIQAAITACQSDTQYGARELLIPAGKYKITSPLSISKQFISIRGEGKWASEINFTGVSGGGIVTTAITYLRPFFRDFSVKSDSTGGIAIDFSAITSEVYLGELTNLHLEGGGSGLYAPNFFSMVLQNCSAISYNSHAFRVNCGPGTSWISCYAVQAASGKAGYRLAGSINMFGCNGVNTADYWGIFGNDNSSADGFQSDFGTLTDYPDINLVGCNIENFGSVSTAGEGIRVQNYYRGFNIIGGKIDRDGLATAYQALIHCRQGSNGGNQPVRMAFSSVFLGAGTPSLAYLYAATGARFVDENYTMIGNGVTTFYNAGFALTYPVLYSTIPTDIYGDHAVSFTAIKPRRITAQVIRYDELSSTPVGSNQVINVTGYSKVVVTPASAASVKTMTFTQVPGSGDDYLRNGYIIVEAGNANCTLIHNWGTAGQMRMKAGVNLAMGTGDIALFVWSSNSQAGVAGWVQI